MSAKNGILFIKSGWFWWERNENIDNIECDTENEDEELSDDQFSTENVSILKRIREIGIGIRNSPYNRQTFS